MKTFFLKKIKEKVKNFDYFELGNSFFLYYLLIFGGLPLAVFLNLPSKHIEYFIGQNISVINGWVFIYLLLGILFFILGYRSNLFSSFAKKFLLLRRLASFFKREWDSKKVFLVFGGIFILNLFIKGLRIFGGGYFHLQKSQAFTSSSFYSLIGLMDWLGPIALAIAFAYYFYLLKINDSRYIFWRLTAWLVFVFEFIFGFLSGGKFYAIVPIIIYLIIRHYVYKRSLIRVVIAGLLIFFVLMPALNFYNKPLIFFHSYTTENKIKFKNLEQFAIDSSLGRVNQSKSVFNIFEKTDKFLYGKSLLNFFISLGPPRFIWKDKPIINASGNEFGRAYGIIKSDNYQTTVGPTIIGDWYMNFGVWGIIFGMLFFGSLYRFIFDLFIRKSDNSLSGAVIYAIFWIQIIKGTEDWIVPVWAGLVKLFVILLVIHFLLIGFKWKSDKH